MQLRLPLAAQYFAVGTRRTLRRRTWELLALADPHRDPGLWVAGDDDATWGDINRATRDVEQRVRRGIPPFVATYSDVLVEPRYGWAISPRLRLEDYSLTRGWETRSWKGREWIGLPSPLGIARSKLNPRTRHLPEAISLLSPWPENYYHFISDVLPKLVLFDQARVPRNLPVLVSAGLAETGFFREARSMGDLENRQFIPLDAPIRVDTLFVAQPPPLDVEAPRGIPRLLGHKTSEKKPGKRVFVTRAPHRGRTIENLDALEPAIAALGFEIIDLDGMPLRDQMTLFGSAELVAGIHGAAFANLIFAQAHTLPFFEIIPHGQDEEMSFFKDLCELLNFPFMRFHGVPMPYQHKRANFRVDPVALGIELEAFVKRHAIADVAPAHTSSGNAGSAAHSDRDAS